MSLSKKQNKTSKDAVIKALELLNYKMRTEKELREKLAEYGYSCEEIDGALEFTKQKGYVDDSVYAEEYAYIKHRQKGKRAIVIELVRRGVAQETAQNALEELDYIEEDVIYELLLQKAGEPHTPDEREYARLFRFLEGRGFRHGDVYKALGRYKDEAAED